MPLQAPSRLSSVAPIGELSCSGCDQAPAPYLPFKWNQSLNSLTDYSPATVRLVTPQAWHHLQLATQRPGELLAGGRLTPALGLGAGLGGSPQPQTYSSLLAPTWALVPLFQTKNRNMAKLLQMWFILLLMKPEEEISQHHMII